MLKEKFLYFRFKIHVALKKTDLQFRMITSQFVLSRLSKVARVKDMITHVTLRLGISGFLSF